MEIWQTIEKVGQDQIFKTFLAKKLKIVLENNPAPSNFLSRQNLYDYLLEILSETGKKDEIVSDRSLIKAQENLINIMGPLCRIWAHLNHLKKANEGVIDLNMLLELVDQCVMFIGQCHSRGWCFRKQRVITAFLKTSIR